MVSKVQEDRFPGGALAPGRGGTRKPDRAQEVPVGTAGAETPGREEAFITKKWHFT